MYGLISSNRHSPFLCGIARPREASQSSKIWYESPELRKPIDQILTTRMMGAKCRSNEFVIMSSLGRPWDIRTKHTRLCYQIPADIFVSNRSWCVIRHLFRGKSEADCETQKYACSCRKRNETVIRIGDLPCNSSPSCVLNARISKKGCPLSSIC